MKQGRYRPLHLGPSRGPPLLPGEHYSFLQLAHHSPWLQPADGGAGKELQDLRTRVISSLVAPPVQVGETHCVHGGMFPVEIDPPGEQPYDIVDSYGEEIDLDEARASRLAVCSGGIPAAHDSPKTSSRPPEVKREATVKAVLFLPSLRLEELSPPAKGALARLSGGQTGDVVHSKPPLEVLLDLMVAFKSSPNVVLRKGPMLREGPTADGATMAEERHGSSTPLRRRRLCDTSSEEELLLISTQPPSARPQVDEQPLVLPRSPIRSDAIVGGVYLRCRLWAPRMRDAVSGA